MATSGDLIRVEHVIKEFNHGAVKALNDCSLTIQKGEVVAIIGPSGSGKSTLLRCLNLLEVPSSGHIYFNDVDITDKKVDIDLHRRKMGMVFQHFNLFPHMTVQKNITLAPVQLKLKTQEEADKQAMELLERIGLADKANEYPNMLSGGQKQRIAIARALASNPKVLLCDEATSALDPTTTRSILRLIQDINRRMGITAVIITHEMAVVEEICSHVAILERGRMVETGTVEAVFSNPQTEAGRRLVFPEGANIDKFPVAGVVRVVFNGGSSYEPLIASLAIDCGVKVNILGADTRNVNGKAFGSMLLGLPEDHGEAVRAMNYLKAQKDVTVEEVPDYHG